MKFDELNAEFVGLRNLLRTFVDENALGEITIQPPVGDDEASFLRLVAWSYAALFRGGQNRHSVPAGIACKIRLLGRERGAAVGQRPSRVELSQLGA